MQWWKAHEPAPQHEGQVELNLHYVILCQVTMAGEDLCLLIFLVTSNLLCYMRQLMNLSSGLGWKKWALTSAASFLLLPRTSKSGHVFDCSVISSRCVFVIFTVCLIATYGLQRCLTDLWQHTDNAQQAFLVALIPMLQDALPSLKKLYASWEKAASTMHFKTFVPAITAGMDKLNTYYQHSAESDAHLMAIGSVFFSTSLTFTNSLCCSSWPFKEDVSLSQALALTSGWQCQRHHTEQSTVSHPLLFLLKTDCKEVPPYAWLGVKWGTRRGATPWMTFQG